MFTLERYILKEHIGPFIFAINIISLVFILNLVFRELGRFLSRGIGFSLIAEFFFLNLAWIIALAVPMAVLIATLMAFGRLAGDNEIVAMKASGISIYRIIFPVLVASAALAILLIWFNNVVLPEFNHRARLLAQDIGRKRPTLSLEPGIMFRDLNDYNIMVLDLEEKTDTSYVKEILIEDNSDPNSNKTIFAKEGKIFIDQISGQLNMILYNGEIHELDLKNMEEYRKLGFPKHRISITVSNMSLRRSQSEHRGDREKSAQMMRQEVRKKDETILDRKNKIKKLLNSHFTNYFYVNTYQKSSDQKTKSLLLKEIKPIRINKNGAKESALQKVRADHQRLQQHMSAELNVIKHENKGKSQLMVEVHKKYSIPISCIIFVLIGAPLGIMARKGNMAFAGGISFGFFLIYWASLIGGEELADNRIISPFLSMWMANIIVGAGGIYLVIHSIRESTIINWYKIGQFFKSWANEDS